MKKYTLPVSEETVNYFQRLEYDIDTRLSVIDRLFTNHKDDKDASLFDSVPFKTYSKQLDDVRAEYALAKDEFTKSLIPLIKEKERRDDVDFDWKINDFSTLLVEITINN